MSTFSQFRRSAGDELAHWTPAALILAYHRVAPEDGPDPWRLRVDPHRFEEHLKVLCEQACRPLSSLFDSPKQRRSVAITFDDGYADNLLWAAPLLQKYGLPATCFLVTDGKENFWWDRLTQLGRLDLYRTLQQSSESERDSVFAALPATTRALPLRLNASQILQLAALPGVEIGAHTLTHPALAGLDSVSVRHELEASRRALEEMLERPVTSFSYPFGSLPQDLSQVEQSGFSRACTVRPDLAWEHENPYLLPRMTVENWTGEEFQEKLSLWLA